jgi:hypothetical protein
MIFADFRVARATRPRSPWSIPLKLWIGGLVPVSDSLFATGTKQT